LIVVGGGLSGTCAAIAAARGGVKVLLVDKSNCLGGAAMNCLVTPFTRVSCMIDGEKVFIAAGIFGEIREKLMEREALDKPFFKDEELKQVLNDMAREAGVELLFHAYLTEAERDADRIISATFSTVAGKITLSADYFIDATGDAQLSFLAGIPTKLGRESDSLCQPMTLCFRVGGVDVDAFSLTRKN
jgi:flavin-dependent dehydrogenase